jgi:hypothetical protein
MRRATGRGPFATLLLAAVLLVPGYAAHGQHTAALKRRSENVFASLPFDASAARNLALSPDAMRSAFVRAKDGGFCAVVDGAEGPAYEGVGRAGVVFSPDGKHAAYAARRQGKWRVVLDGKEGEPSDAVNDETLTFGAEGGRLAYVADRGGKASVVVDGQVGPPFDRVIDGTLAFSPDGTHVAYAAADAGREFVVHDGAPGPRYASVGPPRFSTDGAHFAYAAASDDWSAVVYDGGEAAPRYGGGAVQRLSVTLSPDGRRLALVARGADGRERVVVDGNEGKPYEQVFEDSLAFSGDGARLAYVARRGGRSVVIADGTEVGAHDGVATGSVRFSPAGRRIAYVAERVGAGGVVRRCVAVDGAEGRDYDWVNSAPVFSPDGRHVACVAERRRASGEGFESLLVVDGAEAGAYPWVRGDPVFALDGRRVAYLAAAPDERFADAGAVARIAGNPAAGERLVFHRPPETRRLPNQAASVPIKLLIVEEELVVD